MTPDHRLVCGCFFVSISFAAKLESDFRIGTLWGREWEVGWAGRAGWVLGGGAWVWGLGVGFGGGEVGVFGSWGGWVGERWCGWEARRLM